MRGNCVKQLALATSAALALALAGCSKQAEAPPTAPAVPVPADKANAGQRVVDHLFTTEIIGMNLAYVETLAGPAKRSEMHEHHYSVDGCAIRLHTDEADKVVQALEVDITPACDLSMQPVLGDYVEHAEVRLQDLSFGRFESMLGGGAYYADCLSMCGNAADPNVYLHVEGPRAWNFMQFMASMPLVGDASLAAASTWQAAMEQGESEDYVQDARFNCDPSKYRQLASTEFSALQPSRFSFGRNLDYPKPQCS